METQVRLRTAEPSADPGEAPPAGSERARLRAAAETEAGRKRRRRNRVRALRPLRLSCPEIPALLLFHPAARPEARADI